MVPNIRTRGGGPFGRETLLVIPLSYRYLLRYLSAERFEVELSDGQGVGPSPLVWFDGGRLVLSEQSRGKGLRGLFNPPVSPRYTRIETELGPWLEAFLPQDILEIGQVQGHRWTQLSRRGRLEMRSGDLTRVEFPQARLVNTFEENGSLEVRCDRGLARLKPGDTSLLEGYRLYLHRLEGFSPRVNYLAEGWLARDSYSLDWMMASFAKVGEGAVDTA